MFGLYVTHPQVNIDPAIPVPFWGLSDRGKERARLAAACPWAGMIRRIVSSDETKAMETAAILGSASGVRFEVGHDMGENDRSATGFLAPPQFELAADWFFAHPEQSYHGWERAVDAQTRIVRAVMAVLDHHDRSQPVAFVGHGGVGTLLKCHLQGSPIMRSKDQPDGGGNLFAFDLENLTIACDWTPMELYGGWPDGQACD